MPKVTKITRQKRSADRFSVFVDGAFAFGMPDLDLSASSLREGVEISEAELAAFCEAGELGKAQAAGMRYLAVRPRSIREMQDYLRRKGWEAAEIGVVIEQFEEAGLLDDAKFAETWIANRQLLRPRSRSRLTQELMAKGVSRDHIVAGLSDLGSEDEIEALMAVADRKRRLPQYAAADKLVGYLARQGYTYDVIKKALERLDD